MYGLLRSSNKFHSLMKIYDINYKRINTIIPLDKLLIETDSPFLAPIPMRGKKKEPSYIKYTLDKLAKIKGVNLEYLDKLTTNNFNKLFF